VPARAAVWLACVSTVLAGCATKTYSPSEYRQEVRNYKGMFSSLVVYETVDLARPYQQLSDTVRRKSKECLDATVESSGMVKHGTYWVRETSRVTYKPIFTVGKGKTELTVQGEGTGQPANPVYALDLEPIGKGTRVSYYRGKIGVSNTIHTSVEGWLKGTAATCPNWNG
jgi:hypothetical protein